MIFDAIIRWGKTLAGGTSGGQYPKQRSTYMGRKINAVAVFPYGVHANVPPEQLALMFPCQGAQIPMDAAERPEMAEGDVAVYHPQTGSYIIWREGGKLDVVASGAVEVVAAGDVDVTSQGDITAVATGNANIQAAAINLMGATTVTGNLTVGGTLTLGGQTVSVIPIGGATNVAGN